MKQSILTTMCSIQTTGLIFIFSKKKRDNEIEEETNLEDTFVCKFVLDGAGKKIGESVAIKEDLLIIKSRRRYLGVPLKHIEEDGKTLLVKGLVDPDKAEIMGERWRQENFKEIKYDAEH